MNFLAHFHLAWPDPELVAGGLEGDFFKGPLPGALSPGIERGVRLHRAIDAYTDAHPLIAQLRRRLPPDLRRYGGVLIDLSFDHYLAIHWSQFSQSPLNEFSGNIYSILDEHHQNLSEPARAMAMRLVEHDILNLYMQWETVLASASRIGERFRRGNPFTDLAPQLSPSKHLIEDTFVNFYPQLQSFCNSWDGQFPVQAPA